jgi:uncharacterized protein YyaL (SSP411 family)
VNKLAAEQSPYLLQHAANPVDWYPWGDEAFARARAEDKPIFLSVGYSTCHWCHVMERESFESDDIAAVLNAQFISIKVDREERPDVDRVYMTFVQATTGAGGWPMSVWLTPDLAPFYGGTYYPPTAQWGRPGFREVLLEISRAWKDERNNVIESAQRITERLAEMAGGQNAGPASAVLPGAEALTATTRQFEQSFDRRRGGFGDSPKFPRPSELLFLLREFARTGDQTPCDIVLTTLRSMALGGMRDHIGGGFHRYSVDGNWRVPHFEKMLYDQAQLVLAYLESAQVSGDPFFAQIAEDTLQYVARDLTDAAGGFYSAEDADSIPAEHVGDPAADKSEGAFYIWKRDEIREALGDDSRAFELRYGILPDGNAPFDPQNEFTGKNLLYTARGIADVAQEVGAEPAHVAEALMRARVRLFGVRASRPRPHLDDKVLTSWNGLMIGAFARAARVVRASYYEQAVAAASFLRDKLWDRDRRVLLRRYRAGQSAIDGYAEDYAYLIFGLLELFAAGGDPEWLMWAMELQKRQDDLFWDHAGGGWFSTTGQDPTVLVRMKDDYDGAEPSASAVGAWNLLVLADLTADPASRTRADQVFRAFGTKLLAHGRTLPMMAGALSMSLAAPEQIVIVGPESKDTEALWRAANRPYRPFAQLFRIAPGERQQKLATLLPWVGSMTRRDGQPAAYVCRNFTCESPTTDPEKLA